MSRCPSCQEDYPAAVATCPRDGTALPQGLEGEVLGERYRVVRELGEGGMGRVYLAEHVILGKQLAVKVLRPEYSRNAELVKRFQLEAVAASQIGQENIVDVSDFGKTPDGSFYFVMEYVPGRSLAQIIDAQGPVNPARALPILLQISKALGAAHSRGIVHRDMKPDNVLITRTGEGAEHAKVLDFGISKVGEGPSGQRITQVGMVVGTPHYMAPEQATGEEVDLRADIYAFGIVAYEMLTGGVPFEGDNAVHILMRHQTEEPRPVRQAKPELKIPESIEALVMHCLAKRREERPQNMADVGRAITACMVELGIGVPNAVPASSMSRTAPDQPAPISKPRPAPLMPVGAAAEPPKAAPRFPEVRSARKTPTDPVMPGTGEAAVPQRKLPVALFAGLGAAAVVVLGLVALIVRSSNTPAVVEVRAPVTVPAKPVAEVAQAKPVEAPKPQPVRVAVRSVPAGAKVFADGSVVGATPYDVELTSGQTRELKLVADGFKPATYVVHAGDHDLDVKLEPVQVAARTVPVVAHKTEPKGKASQVSPPKDPSDSLDPIEKVDDIKDPYAGH